jgi:hypothetical protein
VAVELAHRSEKPVADLIRGKRRLSEKIKRRQKS